MTTLPDMEGSCAQRYADSLGIDLDLPTLEQRLASAGEHDVHFTLVDLWGEVDRLVRLADADEKAGASAAFATQLASCCKLFYIVEHHPHASSGLVWELEIAEAMLFDFLVGENRFGSDTSSVMRWFDQWYKGYNFSTFM